MSTTDVSKLTLNRAGNKRGLHPNCLKNLNPAQPGEDRFKNKNGYTVTHEVRDILKIRERRKAIAEKMVSESEAGNVPMLRELLDRTEGKVKEETPPVVPGSQVLNIIVVGGSDNLKDILAQVRERTKQLSIGETL